MKASTKTKTLLMLITHEKLMLQRIVQTHVYNTNSIAFDIALCKCEKVLNILRNQHINVNKMNKKKKKFKLHFYHM